MTRTAEIPAAGGDSVGLVARVRTLEARKALLSGAVAALGAPPERASELFTAALSAPGARAWPFDRARVQLLYGERLRRSRQITEARGQLEAARAAFELLGASSWAE